jgi:short subunit dehydrogenase-like uncharacterized protein
LNRRIYKAKLGYDPLLKTSDGSKASGKFIAKNQSLLGYSKEFKSWIGPSLMASVICNCVKRSNALNNYNPNTLVYKESAVYSNFFEGFSNVMSLVNFGSALMIPPLRWLLRSFVLPKPGEGPSESQMDAGYLKITTIGEGTSGGKARAVILFKTDPGYRDTARMLVESGLSLALDFESVKKISPTAGCLTPATCQKDVLLNRLISTGCSFFSE